MDPEDRIRQLVEENVRRSRRPQDPQYREDEPNIFEHVEELEKWHARRQLAKPGYGRIKTSELREDNSGKVYTRGPRIAKRKSPSET